MPRCLPWLRPDLFNWKIIYWIETNEQPIIVLPTDIIKTNNHFYGASFLFNNIMVRLAVYKLTVPWRHQTTDLKNVTKASTKNISNAGWDWHSSDLSDLIWGSRKRSLVFFGRTLQIDRPTTVIKLSVTYVSCHSAHHFRVSSMWRFWKFLTSCQHTTDEEGSGYTDWKLKQKMTGWRTTNTPPSPNRGSDDDCGDGDVNNCTISDNWMTGPHKCESLSSN